MRFFQTLSLTAALTIAAGTVSAQTTVDMINPLPRSTNFFPLVVGEELGYFADEGVEVILRFPMSRSFKMARPISLCSTPSRR